jgi:hypothetical protein
MAAPMAVSKILYIDNREIIKFSKELEKMGKNTLPKVVAFTLNNAAFDVKQKSIPASTKSKFTIRQQNFFKATSGVDKASASGGIDGMEATVGFEAERAKANKYAVKGLEQQEDGGVIKKRSFIPTKDARGGNNNKLVRANARLKKIKLANRANAKGANWAQQMIKTAIHVGVGGHILTEGFNKKRGGALYKITSIKRKGNGTVFKTKRLYTFSKNRTVSVKKTGFMKQSANESAGKLEKFFIENAKRIIG